LWKKGAGIGSSSFCFQFILHESVLGTWEHDAVVSVSMRVTEAMVVTYNDLLCAVVLCVFLELAASPQILRFAFAFQLLDGRRITHAYAESEMEGNQKEPVNRAGQSWTVEPDRTRNRPVVIRLDFTGLFTGLLFSLDFEQSGTQKPISSTF
jgi:hypothetical protein